MTPILATAARAAALCACRPACPAQARVTGPATLWSGLYSDISLGFGAGRGDVSGGGTRIDLNGPAVISTIGYNAALSPHLLFGVEMRTILSRMQSTDRQAEIAGLASIHYRIGYAGPKALAYLFGGLAAAAMKANGVSYLGKGPELGVGMQYAIANRISARFDLTVGRLHSLDRGTGLQRRFRVAYATFGVTWLF